MFQFRKNRINRPLAQTSLLLDEWYKSPHGQRLLAETTATLTPWLEQTVGYYAVHAATFEVDEKLLSPSRTRLQVIANATHYPKSHLLSDFSTLPFATESLDLIIAHHVFEFVSEPHEFLREVERVLIPEGRLIIVAFNPFGAQGLFKLVQLHRRAAPPWSGHFYSSQRIRDWLSVLGFKVEQTCYFSFPMTAYKHSADRRSKIPLWCERFLPISGSLYAVFALKQVSRLIPMDERWDRRLVRAKVAQPTT